MAVAQRMSEQDYEKLVLADPSRQWELVDGQLRERPGMSWDHGRAVTRLGVRLQNQLDEDQFEVRFNEGRVRRPTDTIFIPDLLVVPVVEGEPFAGRPGVLAIFGNPLPLVVEVWSESTGDYDVDTKIPVYQQRGDLEIWRIHPYERTLTRWVRQPDGSYKETVHRGGMIALAVLPWVTIDLDAVLGA